VQGPHPHYTPLARRGVATRGRAYGFGLIGAEQSTRLKPSPGNSMVDHRLFPRQGCVVRMSVEQRANALEPFQQPVGQSAGALRDPVVRNGDFERALEHASEWLVFQTATHDENSALSGTRQRRVPHVALQHQVSDSG
jgi:hypothetical protein